MRKAPTDLEILNRIYERYYVQYASYTQGSRAAKIYLPIDCAVIARDLGVDNDIVFGRLYYYLDKKHGYTNPDGTRVPLFTRGVGDDRDCVHFPMLASLLADLRYENRKFRVATSLAMASIVIALTTCFLSVIRPLVWPAPSLPATATTPPPLRVIAPTSPARLASTPTPASSTP